MIPLAISTVSGMPVCTKRYISSNISPEACIPVGHPCGLTGLPLYPVSAETGQTTGVGVVTVSRGALSPKSTLSGHGTDFFRRVVLGQESSILRNLQGN